MPSDRFRKHFPLVVPSWVVKQLHRQDAPPSTLFDLTKLAQICSLEDLAILFCLNTQAMYAKKIFGSGSCANTGLAEYWSRYHSAALAKVLQLESLYKEIPEERLFQPPQPGDISSKPTMFYVEGPALQAGAIAIILKPGQLGGADQREVQQYIVREYMRQLYVFTDYATLARDALFWRYLKDVALDNVSEPA